MLVELDHNGVILDCIDKRHKYGEEIYIQSTTDYVRIEVDIRMMRGLE
jgi:hypothetical protein